MTPIQAERLARMAAALRPEWTVGSLITLLTNGAKANPHRSVQDTAHALVHLALDPETETPGRLHVEDGPWWRARPTIERKITAGTDAQLCPRCRGIRPPEPAPGEPPETHTCRPTQRSAETAAAVEAARHAAAKAAGAYERAAADTKRRRTPEPAP